MTEEPQPFRSGFAAIVGSPNVGKSTLLNSMLGQKVSVVTPKPQTTRTRVLGIKTLPEAQLIFVDTPGIHRPSSLMSKRMVQSALDGLAEAQTAVWVLDASRGITREDIHVRDRLGDFRGPVVIALNKVDLVNKLSLLPLIEECSLLIESQRIVPVSALTHDGLSLLVQELVQHLPEGPPLYPPGEITDRTERFLAAEAVREKIFILTRQEVPYSCAVTVDQFDERPDKNLIVIAATVLVERKSHKAILIGRGGSRLREIGTFARREIETLLEKRVYLELFVKAKEGWSENPETLKEMGL